MGLVCYQGGRTLRTALESVLRQLDPAFRHEVLVIDHGSTDGSAELVTEILSRFQIEWRLLVDPTNNLAVSRQKIVEAGCSEKLLFVDSDIFLPRGWIKRAQQSLEASPRIAAVSGPGHLTSTNVTKSWEAGLRRGMRSFLGSFGSPQARLLASPSAAEHLACSAVLFRMSALREGAFDDRFARAGEDLDRSLALRERGWDLSFDPSLRFRHRTSFATAKTWAARIWKLGQGRSFVARKRPWMLLTYPHLLPLSFAPILVVSILGALKWPGLWLVPAGYLVLLLIESIRVGGRFFAMTFWGFLVTHISYSLGQWSGFIWGNRQ